MPWWYILKQYLCLYFHVIYKKQDLCTSLLKIIMEINKRGAYYYAEIMLKDNFMDYFCESIVEPCKNEIIDLFGEDRKV